MKKTTLLFLFLLLASVAFASAPQYTFDTTTATYTEITESDSSYTVYFSGIDADKEQETITLPSSIRERPAC